MFSVFDHGKITKNGGRCGGKSCWHGAFSCKHVAKRQLRTIFTPSFSPVGGPRARPCRRCRPMARRGVPRGRVRLCSAPAIDGPAGRLVFVTICAVRHRRRGPRRKWLAHRRLRQAAVWHCKTGRIAWRNRPFGSAAGHVWQRHSAQVAARKGSCKCFSQPTPHCPDPGAAWGRVRTICLPACILMA